MAMTPCDDQCHSAASPSASPTPVIITPPSSICIAENDSKSSFECTLRMYTVVADQTNTATRISSCMPKWLASRLPRGQTMSAAPAKPMTRPMSVRRSIACARRPRVAISAIHNAAER